MIDDDNDDDFVLDADTSDDDYAYLDENVPPTRSQAKTKGPGKAKGKGKGKGRASVPEPESLLNNLSSSDGENPRVMLISLKAGALGLNLTVANNVYL